jgi:hypothetical protein
MLRQSVPDRDRAGHRDSTTMADTDEPLRYPEPVCQLQRAATQSDVRRSALQPKDFDGGLD